MTPHPVSWLSLLRTARAPLAVVALGAIALVLPSQSSDMLAALADGGAKGAGFWTGTFWFYVALALLTFSGWYWTRALIAARFDGSDDDDRIDPFAWEAVPWLVFVLTFLLGVGLILRSAAWWASIPLLIWLALLLWFWPGRGTAGPPADEAHPVALRSTPSLRQWGRDLLPRFLRLVRRAPGGPAAAGTFVFVALFLFFWGALASFVTFPDPVVSLPLTIAALFHGPGAALFVLALIIAPLAVITFMADGWRIEVTIGGRPTGPARPPVILVLAIWIAVAPWLFHLHTVRVTETVAARQPLEKLFQQWAAVCAPPGTGPVQPIIVAISGGASRAGVWGAQVLQEAEAISAPGRAVFAVSSVSGGSLGAAAYMALMGALTPEELCANGAPTDKRKARAQLLAQQPLGHDVLGAVLAGTLAVDIPRNILSPFAAAIRVFVSGQPSGGDRAEAIERAFEALWDQADKDGGDRLPFGAPYLMLFYNDFAPQGQPPGGRYRAGMPLWIANGTDAGTGGRLVTVPFRPRCRPRARPRARSTTGRSAGRSTCSRC